MSGENFKFSVLFEAVTAEFNKGVRGIRDSLGGVNDSLDSVSSNSKIAGQGLYDSLNIKSRPAILATITQIQSELAQFQSVAGAPASEVRRVTDAANAEIARLRGELAGVSPVAAGATNSIGGMGNSLSLLAGVLASVGLALSLDQIIEAADAYKNLEAQIKLVTGEGEGFYTAFEGVQRIALATNSSLEATGNLFAKIAAVGKTMGISLAESLKITESINQAVQLSGTSAAASEAAITQLVQGLQSGVFRGDEFNSVMEQAPRLATALATSLGVTTGELRNMAEAGQLSADVVIKGIQSQADVLKREFGTLPETIGRAVQNLKTQFVLFIGETDRVGAISEKAAGFIQMIADNLGNLSVLARDAEKGIALLSSKLGEVDPKAIEVMKSAVLDLYDILKELGVIGVEALGDVIDALNEITNVIGGVESETTEKVGAITRTLQGLSIAFGFVLDGVYALRIGYNLLVSALQETAGWFMKIQAFYALDDQSRAAANAKAEEYFAAAQQRIVKIDQLAQEFQSRGVERLKVAAGDEDALNARKISETKKTLESVSREEDAATARHNVATAERKAADDAYVAALTTGNQTLILSTKETLDSLETENAKYDRGQRDREKAHTKAIRDAAQAMVDANGGILNATIQNDAAFKGYLVTLEEGGKVAVKSYRELGAASTTMGLSASDAAKNAAKALGVDLDVALNTVSRSFLVASNNVKLVGDGFTEMKAKGLDASGLLVSALQQLTEQTKNRAELDAVTALWVKFGKEGKLSTAQIEEGLIAVKNRLNDIPEAASEVAKALKLLGIISDEELKRTAQQSVAAYNTIKESGTASMRELSLAAKKAADDTIAANNGVATGFAYSELAAYGLEVQMGETGSAAVSAMNSTASSTNNATSSVHSLAEAYKDVATQAHEAAAAAKQQQNEAYENHPTQLKNALNGLGLQHYDQQNVQKQLTDLGYSEIEARRRAIDILRTDLERRQQYARSAAFGDVDVNQLTNKVGVDAAIAKLADARSKVGSGSPLGDFAAPNVNNSSRSPNTAQTETPRAATPSKTINVVFTDGSGQQTTATINANDESSFLRLLENAKGVSG